MFHSSSIIFQSQSNNNNCPKYLQEIISKEAEDNGEQETSGQRESGPEELGLCGGTLTTVGGAGNFVKIEFLPRFLYGFAWPMLL